MVIQKGEKMRTESIDSRISLLCKYYNTSESEMSQVGLSLLKLFRDVCRGNIAAAEDMLDEICYDSDETDEIRKMNESLVKLEFFTPEARKESYEDEIRAIIETGMMIRIMDAIKAQLYEFPVYGPEFVSILTMTYMSNIDYSEQDILEELRISRSAYFRKKKRAIIMFGLSFISFKDAWQRSRQKHQHMESEQSFGDFV